MAPGCDFDCERAIVLSAFKAVSRFYAERMFFSMCEEDDIDIKLMLRDLWDIFEMKMPPCVRCEVADISSMVYHSFGSVVDVVPEHGDDDTEDLNTRKRCILVVEAFLDAMVDLAMENDRFVTDFSDSDGEEYYPRALWHMFFRSLTNAVRKAAFPVHEKYIHEFVFDRNVDDFETDEAPKGICLFPDELRRSARRDVALIHASSRAKRSFEEPEDDVAPPPKLLRSADIATVIEIAHKYGTIGKCWDEVILPIVATGIAAGIASVRNAASNFFRN